jgi:hypothetical protein
VQALASYAEAGAVRAHETPEAAREAVVAGWWEVRQAQPQASQVMLAYTRDDVAALNGLARSLMREAGALGPDHTVETTRGARLFAEGERIVFLRNERDLGVKNGTLGVIENLSDTRMAVRLDDGRRIAFDHKTYVDLDHGYATTIHKSQGVTVDRAHVLASGYLDRHATYVALSRHRHEVTLHYDRETFADAAALGRGLSRERAKDSTLDYPDVFAARRGIGAPGRGGLFAGFRPGASSAVARRAPSRDDQARAQAFARAWRDVHRMQASGLEALPHQQIALDRAAGALERTQEGLASRMSAVMAREPALGNSAARGRPDALLRAAALEPQAPSTREVQPPQQDRGRDWGLER